MARTKGAKKRVTTAATTGPLRRSTRSSAPPSRLDDTAPPATPKKMSGDGSSAKVPPRVVKSAATKRRGRPAQATAKSKAPAKSATAKRSQKSRAKPTNTNDALDVKPKVERFSMDKIVGEYTIECRAISAGWATRYTYNMTISIHEPDEEGRISAAFDLGFINGTFRITLSEHELKEWCAVPEPVVHQPTTPPRTSPTAATGSKRTREGEDEDVPKIRRSKRVKVDDVSAHANRVHVCWRGISEVDGTPYVDDAGQVGYLDFPGAHGDAFWGVLDFPTAMGAGIAISGTRLTKAPADEPLDWEDFDEAATPEAGAKGASSAEGNDDGGEDGSGNDDPQQE